MRIILVFVFVFIYSATYSNHPYVLPSINCKTENLKGNVKYRVQLVDVFGNEFVEVSNYNIDGYLISVKLFKTNKKADVNEFLKLFNLNKLPSKVQKIPNDIIVPNTSNESRFIVKVIKDSNYYLVTDYQFKYSHSWRKLQIIMRRIDLYTTEKYYYNKIDSLVEIEKTYKDLNEHKTIIDRIFYNYHGDTIDEIKIENKDTVSINKMVLNTSKDVIFRTYLSIKDGFENKFQYEYQYDNFNHVVLKRTKKSSEFDLDTSLEIENFKYSFDGKLICKNKTEETKSNKNNYIRTYIFENERLKYENIIGFENDFIKFITKIEYNQYQDVVSFYHENYHTNSEGNYTNYFHLMKIDYEYDINGNWIVRKEHNKNQLDQVIERRIWYY
jgi:hypothetical protein